MAQERLDTVTAADLSLEVARRSSISREKPELPGYELGKLLGAGAFGQVYKGVQKSTGQTVAVKVLFSVTEGLRDEVVRLSKVSDHPNIVTLVDASLDSEPPFLVTPCLPESLQQHVPDRPEEADIERVVGWFEEIARALQFVHGRGILHCDLKPANILLDEDNHPRLVDFGQSVALQGHDLRLGSFWFMPWQQAHLAGAGAEVPEVGWDLYALGATVYVLLTGELPRATPAAREELSQLPTGKEKVERYRELVRDSVLRPVTGINSRVDRELAAVVECCLQAAERPRYTSASEVVADLRRRRQKLPVKALPAGRAYWLERFFARHRLSVLVGVLALGLLVTGFSWSSYQIYQARQARRALIVQQYDRGVSLLDKGRASGLVWLAEACRREPREEYRAALQERLSKQLRIAHRRLYRLRTTTAPSPSGTLGIWKDPEHGTERRLIDLTSGETSVLPDEIRTLNLNQKDTVRYRLDGIVLDPVEGRGGPATWRLPPFDSVSPVHQDASLALLVRPDMVLNARRTPQGFRVYDSQGHLRLTAEGPSFSSGAPTFSERGDLVIGWEDGRVEVHLYQDSGNWKSRTLDSNFRGELFCFSPRADRLAGHDGDSKVRVWDLEGKVLSEFELGAPANEMAFDAEGGLLVCATRDALVHGYHVDSGAPAWSPAEMEKSARWVFVQPGGQVVTMSDEVIVWQPPQPELEPPQSLETLVERVSLWTGWVYDDNARVRTLTREEFLRRTP